MLGQLPEHGLGLPRRCQQHAVRFTNGSQSSPWETGPLSWPFPQGGSRGSAAWSDCPRVSLTESGSWAWTLCARRRARQTAAWPPRRGPCHSVRLLYLIFTHL